MPYEKKVKIDSFLSNVSSLLFHNLWKVGLRAQKKFKNNQGNQTWNPAVSEQQMC